MRVGWADVGDVLDRDVEAEERAWAERDHVLLRLVRDMAENWEANNPTTGATCIRELASSSAEDDRVMPAGPCYMLSPTSWPETDHITALQQLSTPAELPFANGTEALDTVPIGWAPNAGNVYHTVATLFRVPRSNSMAFEARWLEEVTLMAEQVEGEVFMEAQGPSRGAGDQTGEWLLSVGILFPIVRIGY